MKESNSTIRLTVPDFLTENEIAELTSDVKQFAPDVQQVRPEPYAAMEWIIPTALGAYITKPYFDSFLSEAGKDHYVILKGWLKKLTEYSRAKFKSKTLTANGSELKISKEYTQSSSVSVTIELLNGKRLKLLFDLTLTEQEWNKAIEDFLDLFAQHHTHYPNDNITVMTNALKGVLCYAIIDKETLNWIFLDDSGMYKKLSERVEAN